MTLENTTRRRFLHQAAASALALSAPTLSCGSESASPAPKANANASRHNFQRVYSDPALKKEFHAFLSNVFHLYPEDALHAAIARAVAMSSDDAEVYRRVADVLPDLEPWFGTFRYALPALAKQKRVMTAQTLELLEKRRSFAGYLELGSHGRYLSSLTDALHVDGPIYTCAPKAPSHSLEDIVDRGRIATYGEALPWTDYLPFTPAQIAPGSLSLVTVYIGFHHCPPPRREAFIASIHDAMAPGGKLVLRDHDVTSEALDHLVGLAHDVFNVGTKEPWTVNARELRHFYPLAFIVDYLTRSGFSPDRPRLLQAGDPTRNTLLSFSKA